MLVIFRRAQEAAILRFMHRNCVSLDRARTLYGDRACPALDRILKGT